MLAAEMSGRRKARQHLLTLSDQQLEDADLSRERLLQGLSAWPWQKLPADTMEAETWVQVPSAGRVANDVRYTEEQKQAV